MAQIAAMIQVWSSGFRGWAQSLLFYQWAPGGWEKRDAIAVNKMTIKSQAVEPRTVKQWHLSHKCVIGYVPFQSGHAVRYRREQV